MSWISAAGVALCCCSPPGACPAGADIWLSRDQSGNSRAAAERDALLEGVSGRVELVHADARDLPFDPGTFDIVMSSLVFHNIAGGDGRNRALREAVRVLHHGGQLRIADFLADRYTGPLRAAATCRYAGSTGGSDSASPSMSPA